MKTEPAMITCPNPLGEGVQTKASFCDVLTGRDPADGILVEIPPHAGPATLTFDLHNRHMYSEELVKTNRGYRRYTATIGVLTMDNTLLSRAVVQNEFRTAADLVDRIGGGAGPAASRRSRRPAPSRSRSSFRRSRASASSAKSSRSCVSTASTTSRCRASRSRSSAT